MKKPLLLKLGLVALLGAGLFVVFSWWMEPRTGICRYTANMLQSGMSRDEVEAIIGLLPGVYTHGTREDEGAAAKKWNTIMATRSPSVYERWSKDQIPKQLEKRVNYNLNWLSDNGLLTVYYDESDRVVHVFYGDLETASDTLRRWLHFD